MALDTVTQTASSGIEESHDDRTGRIQRNGGVGKGGFRPPNDDAGVVPARGANDSRLRSALNLDGHELIGVPRARCGTQSALQEKPAVCILQGVNNNVHLEVS